MLGSAASGRSELGLRASEMAFGGVDHVIADLEVDAQEGRLAGEFGSSGGFLPGFHCIAQAVQEVVIPLDCERVGKVVRNTDLSA